MCIMEGFRKPDGCVLNYPSLATDLKLFQPSILLCLDDFLMSKDMLLFSLVALHNGRVGNAYFNPIASPIMVQDQVLRRFPRTRILICEVDPLCDYIKHFVWRLNKLGVEVKANIMEGWTHGVLSFDLRSGGIPESHKAVVFNVEWFKEIFASTNEEPSNLRNAKKIMKKKQLVEMKLIGTSLSNNTASKLQY